MQRMPPQLLNTKLFYQLYNFYYCNEVKFIRMNLEFLRQYCLSLPNATEDIKYGSDLCYSVGGKIFLGTRIDGPFRTGIKCSNDDFVALTEREGIEPMPRLSVTGWVRIGKASALTKNEWERLIKQSYHLVIETLKKKTKNEIQKPGTK